MFSSRCELTIELDEPNGRFAAGGEVTGRVVVDVNKDCECRRLTIARRWKTRGRGSPASGSEHREVMCSGQWEAGQRHSIPFRLPLPNGPCSYQGRHLQVCWQLEASADIPGSENPTARTDFTVEPTGESPDGSYRTGDPDCSSYTDAEQRASSLREVFETGAVTVFGLLSIGLGAYFAVLMARAYRASETMDLWASALFGLFFVGLGAGVIYAKVLRNTFADLKLGGIEADVAESTVAAGDDVQITVDIPPPSDVHVNAVGVRVVGKEKVVYRRGKHVRTWRHEFYDKDDVIQDSVDLRLEDGEAARFHKTMPIPAEAPPSFYSRRNDILWSVRLHVDIEGWPDWIETIPIDVVPAGDQPGPDAEGTGDSSESVS